MAKITTFSEEIPSTLLFFVTTDLEQKHSFVATDIQIKIVIFALIVFGSSCNQTLFINNQKLNKRVRSSHSNKRPCPYTYCGGCGHTHIQETQAAARVGLHHGWIHCQSAHAVYHVRNRPQRHQDVG